MAAQIEFPTPKTTAEQAVDWSDAVDEIRKLTGDDLDTFVGWWAASDPGVALDAIESFNNYRARITEPLVPECCLDEIEADR